MVQFPKRDRWFPAQGIPQGVLLLTHGLNLHPERMDDLAQAFSASGLEVFRPAFYGHHAENGDFLKVDPEHWEEDAKRFHALVNARAQELKVPLFLGAYSFSALIFQVLREELPFARRVLWAPALKLHFWYPIAALVLGAFPDFTFSSRVPGGYSANAKSGLRAFRSLHHFRNEWKRMHEKPTECPP